MTAFSNLRLRIVSHRTTLSSIGALMGSQLFGAILMAAGGIIQARYVSPETLGYFASFAILAGYLTFLHMGSLTALHRDYPYWLGKGNVARARSVAAVSQGWILIVCVFVAILYAGLSVWALVNGNPTAAAAWAAYLVVSSTSFYLLYLGSTYRSSNDFVTWSKITAGGSVCSFLALPMVILFGFWGLCIRIVVPAIFNAIFTHRHRPVRVAPRFDMRILWEQVKFGLPMDAAGFLGTSCTVATMSWIILSHYGPAVLGLIAFARVAENVIMQVSQAILQVFIPRIAHQMGQTESLIECARHSIKPTLAGIGFMLVVIVVALLACEPAIRLLTPKYVEAIPYVRLLVWIGLWPVMQIPLNVLVADKKVASVAYTWLSAFATFITCAAFSIWLGYGPTAIVVSYLASRGVHIIVSYMLLWQNVVASSSPSN